MAYQKLQLPYRIEVMNRFMRVPEILATLAAFAVPVIDYGFEPDSILPSDIFTPASLVVLFLLFLRVPLTYLFSSTLKSGFSRCAPESWWSLISLGFLLLSFVAGEMLSVEGVLRLSIVGFGLLRVVHLLRTAQRYVPAPVVLFASTYLILIMAGAGLLLLPRATHPDVAIDFVDAMFMSASATCVTGLSLFDVGADFTQFGQSVLLGLFQIGGLGIMTFAAFLSILFGAGMSVRDRVTMGEVLNFDVVGKISRLIMWILGLTLAAEGLGTVLLYGHWVDAQGVALAASDQLYYSVFHSISAFCNAGFSLNSDSMVQYAGNFPVMLPMASLIIIGGLGFTVIVDLGRYKPWHHPLARRLPIVGRKLRRHPLPRVSLQTKIVLVTTLILVVGGGLSFWIFERDNPNTLASLSLSEQLLESFFQGGVTPRTAGFNSQQYTDMNAATQFFTILLMTIGASPGSTGGGLKTTAFAILIIVLWRSIRNRPVEVFKRRIADEQVRRVLVVLITALIVINGAVFTLTLTEDAILAMPRGFEVLTFEVVSAFATVGLSLGATENLSEFGEIVIAICMFLGRIGPLALVYGIAAKRQAKFDYPSESLMLG